MISLRKRNTSVLILISVLAGMFLSVSAQGQESAKPESKPVPEKKREGSAWTILPPLGTHLKSNIDTLLYNYQKREIPAMQSDAYATTGNLGGPGINMIYMDRARRSEFFFEDALNAWTTGIHNQRFYNVYTPMTILGYNFGGNRNNHTDRLQGQFGGNVNRNIGVSAFVDYLYSKGCYDSQSTKDFSWGIAMYFTSHRYELQAIYNHINFLNKENGGITNDLYITDPAEVQGGVDKVNPQNIPTRLTHARNRISGTQFLMTHAYKLGFWTDEQVNDTLTRQVYVPVTRFIYSLGYEDRHRQFVNTDAAQGQDFWENHYFNPDRTDEHTRYWALTNTVGVEMIEGFRKWAQFGLSAYASYRIRRFSQPTYAGISTAEPPAEGDESDLTPLPAHLNVEPRVTQNLLWVGGRLQRTKGSVINYAADVKFGLVGDAAGEIDLRGDIRTNFKLFGDTVSIAANARFSNLTPSYFLRNYISNHFTWSNDFGKIRKYRVAGTLTIPWTRTTLSAGFENVQNLVYFGADCMPHQHSGNLQVFSARLDQRLHFGIWNWNNTVTYQVSSDKNVLPLPTLSVYSNMYLAFKAFKVLDLQIGVDCDYYTRYWGYGYQPATMSFHVQNPEKAISAGNFAYANLYATAKLYKVRFYVMWSHFNQGLFGSDYFSMPHYPVDPRRLMFGLSVDFAD